MQYGTALLRPAEVWPGHPNGAPPRLLVEAPAGWHWSDGSEHGRDKAEPQLGSFSSFLAIFCVA